jgi:mono/diheme cytochrome c family protein
LQRDKAYSDFMRRNKDALHWFRDVPVGSAGMPLVLFKLLPDVMPDLWGPNYAEEVGLFPAPENDEHASPWENLGLPYGLGWWSANAPLVDLPGLDQVRMQVVNVTCAACHTGRVLDGDGKTRYLLGAPSGTFVANAWRAKLTKTVNDPRFTAEAFLKALETKKAGWLYPPLYLRGQELVDTQVLRKKADALVEGVKARVISRDAMLQDYIGKRTYKGLSHLMNGGTPGQVEAFGTAVTGLVPEEIRAMPEGEAKEMALKRFLPPAPAIVDIMSVWNQKARDLAQWDGNIAAPLLRNLIAELGVIGDPASTNFENGVITTQFLDGLPPPSYPFPVDMAKAGRGKLTFEKACGSCHREGTTRFMPLAEIGTDPNRAMGLTEASRKALVAAARATCRDKGNPQCTAEDSKVILDRQTIPGYIAGPLDGIWARAPYFHNGSVANLEQVLVPGSRANRFYRGNLSYDQQRVGFASDRSERDGSTMVDASISGASNRGHEDKAVFFGGIDFGVDKNAREDLLEYLKTL